MHILFAASECVPYSKTGGLADVLAALPKEIARLGHRVTVYLPLYRSSRPLLPQNLPYAIRSLTIPFPAGNRFAAIVDGGQREGVQFYLVECPEFFDRDGLYGPKAASGDYLDNAERFGLFCRAVLESAKQLGIPDLFHLHDWQTALLPVLLRTVYAADPTLRSAATVLTVHNAAYQGNFPPSAISQLLLPWDLFTAEKLEFFNAFNWLKGGLLYADSITAVSPTYAQELQTPEFGAGLDPIFALRQRDLHGIRNGVDTAEWNPARDTRLAAHYTAQNLTGKLECRKDLLHAFGLDQAPEDALLIGMVTRLETQKGLDFLTQIAGQLLQRNVVLAVLGSGEPFYEEFLRNLAAAHPGRVAAQFKYDNALAHKTHAGSDLFLMPSRFEPSGLNQMYALKYGTVPLVRATGGLNDTVEEWNPEYGTGTGFKFHGYNPQDLLAALDRAFATFRDKASWQTLMRNGMAKDFAWEHPAREYVEVYKEVLRRRG